MSRDLFTSVSIGAGGGGAKLVFRGHGKSAKGPYSGHTTLTVASGSQSNLQFDVKRSGNKLAVAVDVFYI